MNRLLFFFFILIQFSSGQPGKFPSETNLKKTYVQALGDFIKAANKKNGKSFDTLHVGKRKNGSEDDFPDIELPSTIEHTQIRLITPKEGEKTQNAVKTRIYINMIGWVNKENAEFKFFVFSNGFSHQYNYSLYYKKDVKKKEYELIKSEYQGPPFEK